MKIRFNREKVANLLISGSLKIAIGTTGAYLFSKNCQDSGAKMSFNFLLNAEAVLTLSVCNSTSNLPSIA